MAIKKAQNVQYPVVAKVSFTYAELAEGVQAIAQLPAGARVVGGQIVVDTAWDTGTSAALDIGDAADDDRYTSTQINLKTATGRTALTLTGYEYAETTDVIVTAASVGTAATAGEATIEIMYVVDGRGHEVQG